MIRAVWKGAVLAASADTVVVEGNHYFPEGSLRREHFRESATHTTCSWKGQASYYDVVVGGELNRDAAWYYPEPKEAARSIAGRVAFWRGVEVQVVPQQQAEPGAQETPEVTSADAEPGSRMAKERR